MPSAGDEQHRLVGDASANDLGDPVQHDLVVVATWFSYTPTQTGWSAKTMQESSLRSVMR